MTKRVLTVIGARPQFIKASVVSKEFTQRGVFEEYIHTGQHYDYEMNQLFFDQLGMKRPLHFLGVGSSTHGTQTGLMMQKIDRVLLSEKPDLVLVYGDTNSTLAGALSARKLNIPLAHVEAGMRSGDLTMPEEINRICADVCADICFAVNDQARSNLTREGIADERISVTGDVMLDACLRYSNSDAAHLGGISVDLSSDYAVATVHRPVNTDSRVRFETIVESFRRLSKSIPVIFPLHPRTRRKSEQWGISLAGISSICATGYLEMLQLIKNAELVITDSGGVQREACFLGRPSVVLRDVTEWAALPERGASKLIVPLEVDELMDAYREMRSVAVNPLNFSDVFGDGAAGKIIAETILRR